MGIGKTLAMWHGSISSDISAFEDGVHLGSWKQAVCAIAAHAALDGSDGDPELYKCKVRLCDENIVTLEDWGTPNLEGALLAYCTHQGERERYSLGFQRGLAKLSENDKRAKCVEYLGEVMKPNGHFVIRYSNRVEGSGFSYFIQDGTRVRIVGKRRPSWRQIAKRLLRRVSLVGSGYNENERTKIAAFLKERASV